jgi:membrane protease subunit HflK
LFGVSGGPGLRPPVLAGLAGVVVFLWALSGLYVVQPDQQAVVTTLGSFSRVETPGLRYHIPAPFERVEKVSVTSLKRIDIGTSGDGADATQSLMLTGDENMVDLSFNVQYRISNPADYLFNLKDPEDAVTAVAESAMREVVGKTALEPILTNGRSRVQIDAAALMQRILDGYQAGVTVDAVQISTASPPPEVIDAFRDVATAGQNAQSAVNVAGGESAKIVQAALGYRAQAIREAEGEAARFNQVYEQYKLAPAVTRQRLYLETMERVLQRSNKIIIDGKSTTAPIVLPSDALRPRTDIVRPAQGSQQ